MKLVIAYDGTSFSGWQRQKNAPTIQGRLEESIGKMTGEQVDVHGAGRTDAGVHSLAMVANFHTTAAIPCSGFLKGLNSILPDEIRIISVHETDADFHSRFCAIGKSYEYNFITASVILPTERLYYAHLNCANFDSSAIVACLDMIQGEHDFSSFEATGSRDLKRVGGMGAVRKIHNACLAPKGTSAHHFAIEINGNGFLRHMVRNIVGTLFEVGSGKKTAVEFGEILRAQNRSLAGPTAPACGLFLKEVFY